MALKPGDVFRRHKNLVVFNMDSTLMQQELMKLLDNRWLKTITESVMNGELILKNL
ncbi:hypothetical protein Glove_421g32 [Diversispora epigaea]|uniref:Uncharacterized protein n=1 Tax=Diversispora epigaea TaxID=1348612 RepID=A0A397GV92_9GLOM|nr:hypothetical protein Glove_421g32 [Diversispora epigaea]